MAESYTHISIVLDHCVQQIEQGKATVDDCLARYPAHQAELAQLLPAALNLQQAPRIELPADSIRIGRSLLLESLPPRPLSPRRSLRSTIQPGTRTHRNARRFTMAWALVIAAVVSLAAGGGVAYAADAAVPGDALYGVDLAMEQVRLSLTSDSEAIFDYQLDRAEERLGEAKKLAAAGDTENLSEALSGYGEAFTGAAEQAGKAGENAKGNAVRTRLDKAITQNSEEIGNLNPGTPAGEQITSQDRDRDAYCLKNEDGTYVKIHPVAISLSTANPSYSAETINRWFCEGIALELGLESDEGFGLGEIMHAIALANLMEVDLDAAGLLDLREVGTGWGNIMRDELGIVGNSDSPGGRPEEPGKPEEPRMEGSQGAPEDPGKPDDAGSWMEDSMGPGESNQNGEGNSNQPTDPGKPENAGKADDAGSDNGGSGNGPHGGTGMSPLEPPMSEEEAPGQGGAGGKKGN